MFSVVFVSALMLFLGVGMHFILNDFGIRQIKETGKDLIGNAANQNSIALDTYAQEHYDFYTYYDYIFLVMMLALFIESVYAAVKARAAGWYSFFGYATIGNVFLLFLIGYATQIQGWILNEFVYGFLTIEIQTPIFTAFVTYIAYIITFWYLILLIVNRIDLGIIKDKMDDFVGNNKEEVSFEK